MDEDEDEEEEEDDPDEDPEDPEEDPPEEEDPTLDIVTLSLDAVVVVFNGPVAFFGFSASVKLNPGFDVGVAEDVFTVAESFVILSIEGMEEVGTVAFFTGSASVKFPIDGFFSSELFVPIGEDEAGKGVEVEEVEKGVDCDPGRKYTLLESDICNEREDKSSYNLIKKMFWIFSNNDGDEKKNLQGKTECYDCEVYGFVVGEASCLEWVLEVQGTSS